MVVSELAARVCSLRLLLFLVLLLLHHALARRGIEALELLQLLRI